MPLIILNSPSPNRMNDNSWLIISCNVDFESSTLILLILCLVRKYMTFNRSLRKKNIVAAVRLDEICVVLVDNALFLINTIISFSFKMSIIIDVLQVLDSFRLYFYSNTMHC